MLGDKRPGAPMSGLTPTSDPDRPDRCAQTPPSRPQLSPSNPGYTPKLNIPRAYIARVFIEMTQFRHQSDPSSVIRHIIFTIIQAMPADRVKSRCLNPALCSTTSWISGRYQRWAPVEGPQQAGYEGTILSTTGSIGRFKWYTTIEHRISK